MENNDFFTQEEHKQLILLYKRLLQLSKDTLQKDDCHKLKTHLVKAMAEGTIPRNVFQMNPIIKDMQTAVIVAEEIGMRRASILGIMLHESVKYNLCSLESVKEEYGEDVAGIIRGLVKINELYSKSPIIESENFRNLLLSFAEDMRVILIIIADRVNLMRQIKDSPNEEARLEVANEAAYLYAPLAHKLGLYKLKSELEDLSLKYTQHDVYYHIKEKLNATKQARDRYIEAFNAQGYENLYLAGFYWENEAISVDTPAEDIELVKQFNAYAHEKGFKTFWVPYFDANYYYYWDQLGFDLACMQSNYSFTVIDEQRLYANAWLCWVNGLSAELEIEDYKSKAGTDKYKAYLECGVKTGYADSVNVYYQGGIPGAIFSSKDYNDDEFGVYRDTCLYASGEMPADYYEPSGAGLEGLPAELTLETTDGKAVEFTLEGIDGLESEITLLPFYGALRLNADGTGRYEPISRFVGEDSFAVTVTDGAGQSKTVAVTITITH